MLKHLVLALAIGATAGFDDPVFGEVATTVSKEWVSITSSTDGVKIAAVVHYGNVWVSTNSGSNFHEVKTTPPKRWTAIVSSWDGVRLAATTRDRLWRSTDSGMNWYEVEDWAGILSDSGYFTGITASYDLDTLAACVKNGKLWRSAGTFGKQWEEVHGVGMDWRAIASSSDGTRMTAVVYGGHVYSNSNSGEGVWRIAADTPMQNWVAITMSATGQNVFAAAYEGNIWRSYDYGESFSELPYQTAQFNPAKWASLASSADGYTLLAAEVRGHIWYSQDAGMNWRKVQVLGDATQDWKSLTASADGSRFGAVVEGGSIWMSPMTVPVYDLMKTQAKRATTALNQLVKLAVDNQCADAEIPLTDIVLLMAQINTASAVFAQIAANPASQCKG